MSEPEWIDGPRLMMWLEREYQFQATLYGAAVARRAVDWKAGAPVSVWKADEVLTRVGLHLSQLPADLWLSTPPPAFKRRPRQRRRCYPAELKNETVEKVEAGASIHEMARETGATRRTIKEWMQSSRQKAAR